VWRRAQEFRWKDGLPLGVLRVELLGSTTLDAPSAMVLKAATEMLPPLLAEVEEVQVGNLPPSRAANALVSGFPVERSVMAPRMQEEVRDQLKLLDGQQMMLELRGYKEDPDTKKILIGILCTLGRDRKQLEVRATSAPPRRRRLRRPTFSPLRPRPLGAKVRHSRSWVHRGHAGGATATTAPLADTTTTALFTAVGSRPAPRRSQAGWIAVQAQLKHTLVLEMLELDVLSSPEKHWAESRAATAGLDVISVLTYAALPVRHLLKWLIATRLLRQATLALPRVRASHCLPRQRSSPVHASPAADRT